MKCEYTEPIDFSNFECKDLNINPYGNKKYYIVAEGDNFKAYEVNGNKLGKYVGNATWDNTTEKFIIHRDLDKT